MPIPAHLEQIYVASAFTQNDKAFVVLAASNRIMLEVGIKKWKELHKDSQLWKRDNSGGIKVMLEPVRWFSSGAPIIPRCNVDDEPRKSYEPEKVKATNLGYWLAGQDDGRN